MKKFLILLLVLIFNFGTVLAEEQSNPFEPDSDIQTKKEKQTKDIKIDKKTKENKTKIDTKKDNSKTTSKAKSKKSNKKSAENPEDNAEPKGYSGNVPNIQSHFQEYQEDEVEPTFEIDENFNDPYKIKPIPRDNPSFVNIILKQEKSSQYVNEINELIFLIEKIQKTIEDEANLQVFTARAYNLDKYIEFFRNKYSNKPESSYASFKKLMELNSEVQALAALRREKEVYSPYVLSSSNGNAFSENNINLQNEYLLENIKSTLIILREVK